MPGIRDLNGKVAVVTGGGSGIGRATALAFASEGASVVLADIRGEAASETAREIEAHGGKAAAHEIDVADRSAMEAFAKQVISEFGQVDVLFNNAGVALAGRFVDLTWEDWDWVMGVDFWGVVHGMQYFVPHMVERGTGHIVNTASLAGLTASPVIAAYSAAKHGVVGVSKAARAELRQHNIGVSVICPGLIRTGIIATSRIKFRDEDALTHGEMAGFMARWGIPPEKVARAVLRAIRRNKSIVTVGAHARCAWILERFSVGLSDALMGVFCRALARRPAGDR